MLTFTFCTLNRHHFLYVNYNSPKLLKFYQSNDPCEQMGEKEDFHNKGTLIPEQIRAQRLFLAKVCLFIIVGWLSCLSSILVPGSPRKTALI